jgi:hypothetical protein
MFRDNTEFVEFIRPAIERGDRGLIRRAESYSHQAVLSGLSRIALERDILDAFPNSELAEQVGRIIRDPAQQSP